MEFGHETTSGIIDGKLIYTCNICGVVFREDWETGEIEYVHLLPHSGSFVDDGWVESLEQLEQITNKAGICRKL